MKRVLYVIAIVVVCGLAFGGSTQAQSSSSDNFQIEESFIGPGGNLESASDNYSTAPGQQSVGNIGVGGSGSNNFRSEAGNETTNDPALACTVDQPSVPLGALSTSTAATGTASFRVLNYTAYGYQVFIVGNTPTNGGASLDPLSSGGTSSPGTEQFGINLVENSSPVAFGADPEQIPDNTFSFGQATTNYDDDGTFRYVSGEAIAESTESSGITDYTISYIANMSNETPGGSYTADQEIICVGTY